MGIPYGAPADAAHPRRDGATAARRGGVGVVRARPRCRCRGWRSRSCSAATCGSGWRTTSTSRKGVQGDQRPAGRAGRARSSRRWAPRSRRRTRPARSSRLKRASAEVRPAPEDVRTVACVGAGVIGGGWVACFLARGYRVVAWDPGPARRARLRHLVDAAWPALTELGLADGRDRGPPDRSSPTWLADAVAEADLVQESAPEDSTSSAGCCRTSTPPRPTDVVIASSTSGFAHDRDAGRLREPAAALVVGHPFNPPYLIPLVEVVGGEQTDPRRWWPGPRTSSGQRASRVITMDREVPGFIANRLQEALWREALHMVAAGEATVEQIDAVDHRRPRPALGVPWARCSPSTWPGGRAAWRTCWTTSDRRCCRRGPGSRRPELTAELRDARGRGLRRGRRTVRTIADLVRRARPRLVDLRGCSARRWAVADDAGRRRCRVARAGPAGVDRLQRAPVRGLLRARLRARHRRGDGRARAGPAVPGGRDARCTRVEAHVRYLARCRPDSAPRGALVGARGGPASCCGSGTRCGRGPAAGHRGGAAGARRHRRRPVRSVPGAIAAPPRPGRACRRAAARACRPHHVSPVG